MAEQKSIVRAGAQPQPASGSGELARFAWLPIPVLLALILALWVADLRTFYESRAVMVLLNLFFTWLASLCICVLTARGFLASGRPGLLMFGCGSLVWGLTSLIAATMVDRVNVTITVHNLGVFGAAWCHFVGLLWRRPLARPGRWLAGGVAGTLTSAALIVWAAASGSTPVFFVQGQGGTPIREVVLLLAVAMFAWVAWQMIYKFRPPSGAFHYWYGLGLALIATGLTGLALLTVQGGILGWTDRLAQYLGGAYLFIAALVAARETGTWKFSLAAIEEAWQKQELLAGLQPGKSGRWVGRYALAVAAVALAIELRLEVTAWVGPGLPIYITLYPAVMVTALLGGFGPGLAATLLAGLAADYWLLPPTGRFAIASPVDRLGLVIFVSMGLFMSAVADLYRRNREKATAYDREAAMRESRARLAAFAEATFEGIVESEAGRILDCNEQLARMLGYTVAELRGREIASFLAPEDLERVSANVRQGQESTVEHGVVRKDGTRIIVEARGRPLSPGSARRHTALRDITERKRLEDARATLAAIVESSEDAIISKTIEGRITSWNAGAERLLGYGSDEMVGQPITRIIPPELLAEEATILERLRHGHSIAHYETVRAARDGRRIPVSLTVSPIRDASGRIIGASKIARDITERKRAEELIYNLNRDLKQRVIERTVELRTVNEALREREQEFRSLAEAMPQIVWATRADGRNIYFNQRWVDYTGMTMEESYGHGWNTPFHPEDKQRAWEAWQRATQHQERYSLECRLRRRDGVYRWWLVRGEPMRAPNGEILKWFGTCTDIEDIKRAEAALQEANDSLERRVAERTAALRASETLLRSITDSAADPIFLKDRAGRMVLANPATLAVLQKPAEAVLGKTDAELYDDPAIGRLMMANDRRVMTSGRPEVVEEVVPGPSGPRTFLSAKTPYRDAQGQVVGIIGIARDITDRNKAEERIQASLRDKEVMLKEIHHRVKNNLQVISSLVDLQADALQEPGLRPAFADLRDRVRSMALVHEKLYQSESLARVEFAEYASSLLGSLWRAHGNAATTIGLKLDLEPVSLPIVSAIPCGLLLNELVINALKHAFPGRTEGEVTVELRSGPDGRVGLCVRDNGVGMPAGQDWRRSPSLGLRLVQMLVEQLDGALEVKAGAGTEFQVSFLPRPERPEN